VPRPAALRTLQTSGVHAEDGIDETEAGAERRPAGGSVDRSSERGSVTAAVVVVVAAACLAAAGVVLLGRAEAHHAARDLEAVDDAAAVGGRDALATAVRSAQLYFSESGTYVGFTPQVAATYEPSIRWSDGPASTGQVSVRAASSTGVVFVTQVAPGAYACAAASGSTVTYGTQDATTPEACTGG
jgi:hypothetical protein